jgi:hypothetical protein
MASSAFWAAGSLLQAGDGAGSEVFTSIAEITKLTPPNLSRDDIDVTHTLSSNGYREFIGGWRDGGEVSMEANWLPTGATQSYTSPGLHGLFNAKDVPHNWKILVGTGPLITIAFTGFITAFEPDLDIENQGKLSVTIKISGKPIVT